MQRILIYSFPTETIETLLREIKEKLLELQDDITTIKLNKTLTEYQNKSTDSKC